MMIPLLRGAALAACVIPVSAQGFTTYLQQRYSDLQKITVPQALAEARSSNVVTTDEQARSLKRSLIELREGKGDGCGRGRRLDCISGGPPQTGALTTPLAEVEWNGDLHSASPVSPSSPASGDNSLPGDIDIFRWDNSTDVFVTASILSDDLVLDSQLTILAANGTEVAFNDDAFGLLSSIGPMYVPAGTYYFVVESYQGLAGAPYELRLATQPATIHPCGTTPTTGTTGVDAWVLDVPAAGVVSLDVVASVPGAADLAIAVLLGDGSLAFFDDDKVGNDPGVQIGLPPGSYPIEVFDIAGGSNVPYSLTSSFLPGLGTLLAGSPSVGSIGGDHDADLFVLDLAAPQRVSLATTADPAQPSLGVGDSILAVRDRDLRLLLEVDDPTLSSSYASVSVALPAGRYYVQIRGFPGATGSFALALTGTSAFAHDAVLRPGAQNPVTTTAGTARTLRLDVATEADHFLRMSNDYFGVVNDDGTALVGSDVRADLMRTRYASLAQGTWHVIAYDRFASTGPRSLRISPTDAAIASNGMFTGHAKFGSILVLGLSMVRTAPVVFMPEVQGYLGLLDPPVCVAMFVDATGNVGWFMAGSLLPPPGLEFWLQQAELAGVNRPLDPGYVGRFGGLTSLW